MQITINEAEKIAANHFGDFMRKLTMNGFEVCRECGGSGQLSSGIDDGMTYCHVCQTGAPYWTDAEVITHCMVSCECSEDEAKEIIRRGEMCALERDAEDLV